jgi:signal transduction histidine kinase
MAVLRSLRARVRALGPGRADALVAFAYLVEAELEIALLAGGKPHAGLAALCVLPVAGGLALRRRAPLAALLLAMAGLTAIQPLGRPVNDNVYSMFFAALFLLFSTGLHLEGRRLIAACAIAIAALSAQSALDDYPSTALDYLFGSTIIGCGPILLGSLLRQRSRLNATLREKAERLRRERAEQAEQAAAEERTRIAGELHDVVTHAMSAMVVQAAGARRLAERNPQRAHEAFAAVETTGREALTEIRRLLGVLRREDEAIALAPQPSLRHLSSLVQRTRAAGLPVDLTVDGEQRALPPGVDLTAYRLVQEALSGALEHGAAGRAAVTVRYGRDAVEVEVVDDGAGKGSRTLGGARARVSLYGGRLHAARRAGGGHAVSARLPVGGGA